MAEGGLLQQDEKTGELHWPVEDDLSGVGLCCKSGDEQQIEMYELHGSLA